MRVLVDEPALKLASIVLRAGTVLPTHHSEVPVTITALHGSGTVVAGAERLRLDPTHAVVLAPNVPHSVEPDTGTDLVLLVHHLGSGGASPMKTGRYNVGVGLLVMAGFMLYGFLLIYLRDFAPDKEAWVASYSVG